MPIHEEDVPKTTFRTCWESYKFLVKLFGVTNPPSEFMHLVQDILHKYLDNVVFVFIDDILIFPYTIEEHAEHLMLIFQ